MKFRRSLAFYKPTEKQNGAAAQFKISNKPNGDPVVMVEGCVQSGPKPRPGSTSSPFNWKDDKVTMMLNKDECGQICAYIARIEQSPKVLEKGIYIVHDTDREDGDNLASLAIKRPGPDDKYGNWGFMIKRGDKNVRMYLSAGEIYQIKIVCEAVITSYATEILGSKNNAKNNVSEDRPVREVTF